MPNQPKTPQRSIRISDDLWEAASSRAAAEGTDVSSVVRAALTRYVERSAVVLDFQPTETAFRREAGA